LLLPRRTPSTWLRVKNGPLQGNMTTVLVVDREGRVREIWSVESENSAVNEAGMEAVTTMRFQQFPPFALRRFSSYNTLQYGQPLLEIRNLHFTCTFAKYPRVVASFGSRLPARTSDMNSPNAVCTSRAVRGGVSSTSGWCTAALERRALPLLRPNSFGRSGIRQPRAQAVGRNVNDRVP
jgi:hypothetical protein